MEIEVHNLTKRYASTVAVADLTFRVTPGRVTGFLGPNGAGKSTTMRMILGLDHPTSGRALVGGRPFVESRMPLRTVGALLDAKAVHGGRTAYHHLLALAQSNRIPPHRVGEVLDMVGLAEVASKRIKGFSLGMSQRLGIAAAMLGDPRVLMFDEPVNGLDPEGIRWIRTFTRTLAAEGRTVFLSSHLMSEMEGTADHVIVIGQGRLISDLPIDEFIRGSAQNYVLVRSPQATDLVPLLRQAGATVQPRPDGGLAVYGLDCEGIGDLAGDAGLRLHELSPQLASLEAAFMELTDGSVEYRAASTSGAPR